MRTSEGYDGRDRDYGRVYSHLSLVNEINVALDMAFETRSSLREAVARLVEHFGGDSAALLAMHEGAPALEPVLRVGECEVREAGLPGLTAFFLEAASVIDLLPAGLVEALGYGEALGSCGLAPPPDPHYVAVTIKSRRRPVGLLHVNLPAGRVLHEDEGLLLSILGSQLGAVLENAWLFEEVDRGRREWQATFDSLDDVVILTDGEGKLKLANASYFRYLDASRPDGDLAAAGVSFFREVLARTSLYPPSRAAGRGWEEVEEKDGGRVWRVFSFSAEEGGGAYVVRDVTVERRMEEVQEMNRQLVEVNRLRSGIMARISHDLHTPLNAILGFSDVLLQGDYGALTDRQEKYLRNIHSSGKHLLDLINDVLDLTRMEVGKLELHPAELNPAQVVESGLALFEEEARRRGITLSFEKNGSPAAVEADEKRVKQILHNLLSNAVKFTPDGGSVGVRLGGDDGRLLVEVWDTGAGIPYAKHRMIFEEYAHLGGDGEKGNGLGLAIAKQLVELHGGRIWVESAAGQGSRFYFSVPAAPAAGRASGDAEGTGAPRRERS